MNAAYECGIFMLMRSTLILSDDLVSHAREVSGIERISDLVRAGLSALIAQEARRRLISFGASDPEAFAPGRRQDIEAVAERP